MLYLFGTADAMVAVVADVMVAVVAAAECCSCCYY
jgi:hypothetical protein